MEAQARMLSLSIGDDDTTATIGGLFADIYEGLLYKLTAAKEVPHYKPRGKMLYFNREEIDKWLLQNKHGDLINNGKATTGVPEAIVVLSILLSTITEGGTENETYHHHSSPADYHSFVCQSVSLVGGSGRKDKHRRQSQGFGQPLARDGASPWRGIALLGLNEQQGRALVCAIIETV